MVVLRNIFFITGLLLLGCWQVKGQNYPASVSPFPLPVTAVTSGSGQRAGNGLLIDYYATDLSRFGAGMYHTAIWNMNMHYGGLSVDSLLTYAIIAYDTLAATDSSYFYTYGEIGQPTLDSLWIYFGHENNSGVEDTLIVDVVHTDTAYFPGVLSIWSDTLVFASGQSSANNWMNTTMLSLAPGILLKRDTAFAVRIRYYGALQDTFGLVLGYGTDLSTCGSFPEPRALKSHFYPNSYAYWNTYQLLLPSASGGDLYYDCNANFQFDTLTDGASYIQNWRVPVLLSSMDVGVEEINVSGRISVYPNPASDILKIASDLPGFSDAVIRFITPQGHIFPASFTDNGTLNIANLAAGIYYLQINNDEWNACKKIIVVR